MNKVRYVAFILSFFLLKNIAAQQQLGLRTERFSGIWAANLNPSAVTFLPTRWDVNLGQMDFFAHNSYAFFANTSLPFAAKNFGKIVSAASLESDERMPSSAIPQDFYLSEKKFFGVGQMQVAGIGGSFQIGDQHTFGLTTAFRAQGSAYQVPTILAYETLDTYPLLTDITVTPMRAAGMAWGEIGFLYGWNSYPSGDVPIFSFAVQPKFLMGFEGGYGHIERDVIYQKITPKDYDFQTGRVSIGATNTNFDITENQSVTTKVNGRGFGLNLGFSLAMPDPDANFDKDYLWRMGVSLVDIGAVAFKKNTEVHNIDFNTSTLVSSRIFSDVEHPREFFRSLSGRFLGDSSASLKGDHFTIGLPTQLSFQFDIKIFEPFHIAAVLQQRIPMANYSLKNPNFLAIVPRAEHRWASVAVPITWSDYRDIQMGFAFRVGYLAFGTDQLGWLFKKQEQTGADFYIGLKINGFQMDMSKLNGGLGKKGRTWHKVGCFEF